MSKPEALRLADALMTLFPSREDGERAAAELRRLAAVEAQRDALLLALKQIEPILARMYGIQAADLPPTQAVRAAIAKAENQ